MPPEMPAMPAPAQGASPADQGSVMISMPREALEGLRQMISQLSAGVEELAKQAEGAGQTAPTPVPEGPSTPEGAPADDKAFLADMAREGSTR